MNSLRQRLSRSLRSLLAATLIGCVGATVGLMYQVDFENRLVEPSRSQRPAKQKTSASKQKEATLAPRLPFWRPPEQLELRSFDLRMHTLYEHRILRGSASPGNRIIILGLDDQSFTQIGKFPWPRRIYAHVVDKLHRAGAKVIAFDVSFTENAPDPRDDEALEQSVRRAGSVVLPLDHEVTVAQTLGYSMETLIPPIEGLDDACRGEGFINVEHDSDDFVRLFRTYILYQDRYVIPSFPLEVAATYLGLSEDQLERQVKHDRLGSRRIYTFYKHMGVIDYWGPAGTFPTYSFYLVWKDNPKYPDQAAGDPANDNFATPKAFRKFFKGKIVLIGATADVLHDSDLTPFSGLKDPRTGGYFPMQTPGVEIHATMVNQFLTGRHILPVSNRWSNLFLVFMALLTAHLVNAVSRPISAIATQIDAKLSFRVRGSEVHLYSIVWLLFYLLFGLGPIVWVTYSFPSYLFDRFHLWLPVIYSGLGIAVAFMLTMAYLIVTQEQDKREMRGRFGRFVAPSVLTEILNHPEGQPLAKKMEVTLMFTDLQGFTTLTESRGPEEVTAVLNEYFDRMTPIIWKYQGTIDKYIGDAIMVIFGAPVPFPDHAERAVLTAVEMQHECARFREEGRTKGYPDFFMRIGIHSGECTVGSVGSSHRLDYTAIGDTVNLASRLEGLNKQYGSWIMISEDVFQRVKDFTLIEHLDAVRVKGKTQAVPVYKVDGAVINGSMTEPTVDELNKDGAEARARTEALIDSIQDGAKTMHDK